MIYFSLVRIQNLQMWNQNNKDAAHIHHLDTSRSCWKSEPHQNLKSMWWHQTLPLPNSTIQ